MSQPSITVPSAVMVTLPSCTLVILVPGGTPIVVGVVGTGCSVRTVTSS